MQIRQMVQEDWPCVRRIYKQGIQSNQSTLLTECPSFEEWDRSHISTCRLVLIRAEEVVGWAALTQVFSRPCYTGVAEVSIYVDGRNRKQGAGSFLMNGIIQEAEKNGFWSLQSLILAENQASLRLHEKCGFRRVGYREKLGRDRNGNWRDVVLVERRSRMPEYL